MKTNNPIENTNSNIGSNKPVENTNYNYTNTNTNVPSLDAKTRPTTSTTSSTAPKKNSKIDTENIPRPIIYTEEGTNIKSHISSNACPLPPQVHQLFTNVDEGNSNPRLIRPTLTNLPNDPNLISQSQIPLAAIIQPLADTNV